ncbi:spermidine synthase [Thioflavicoccus mobilis 8321]|uniref:Polyamine aminopropyltransferase n=1 Tax=Thioflavicoccus mobilis 8321 TaxID=765912 RepID=L0GSM5_9GAMM|nr:polyamine aminopropyltransferase [Thioflavicoccus mobilis]AGA88971.1 spermidine synthase [Thioflavicoccus mobilis 8321]
MLEPNAWFTEIHSRDGSAFSLRVRAKLHEERTPYQTIAIYDTTDFGRLMVIDGCTMVSDRENFIYHEMMAHPALFTHAEPRRVAIIGGGDCGTLREVLKHPGVAEAVQIDIDERVTRLAERYFPDLTTANEDSRAQLLFDDGIAWVRAAPPGELDLIIVDSTDPVGPAEGLFSAAFYADCWRALGPGGLLVQQSESPLYHQRLLEEMRKAMQGAGFLDVKSLFFPQPIYPSGWWSAMLACKDGPIDGFREETIGARPFSTRYYNAEIHRAAFAIPEFLRRR